LHREHCLLDLLAQRKTPDALLQKGFFIVAPRPGLEPGTYELNHFWTLRSGGPTFFRKESHSKPEALLQHVDHGKLWADESLAGISAWYTHRFLGFRRSLIMG